jgi:hypothetical protein
VLQAGLSVGDGVGAGVTENIHREITAFNKSKNNKTVIWNITTEDLVSL